MKLVLAAHAQVAVASVLTGSDGAEVKLFFMEKHRVAGAEVKRLLHREA